MSWCHFTISPVPGLRAEEMVLGAHRGQVEVLYSSGGNFLDVLPDPDLGEYVAGLRCELALGGPPEPDDDPVGFLLGVGQLVRMGEQADPWVPDLAAATEYVLRDASRRGAVDWSVRVGLRAAEVEQRDLAQPARLFDAVTYEVQVCVGRGSRRRGRLEIAMTRRATSVRSAFHDAS